MRGNGALPPVVSFLSTNSASCQSMAPVRHHLRRRLRFCFGTTCDHIASGKSAHGARSPRSSGCCLRFDRIAGRAGILRGQNCSCHGCSPSQESDLDFVFSACDEVISPTYAAHSGWRQCLPYSSVRVRAGCGRPSAFQIRGRW